jgi:hypothetical protein
VKFVLFVEGYTEHLVLKKFLARWLNAQLTQTVGIAPVRFDGSAELIRETPARAKIYLNSPKQDTLAVIALLDLYGAELDYPKKLVAANDRYDWGKAHLEDKVKHPQFRQFFAVHELEAWLLSSPAIFPENMRNSIASKSERPEEVNSEEPPADFLKRVYKKFRPGQTYKKTTDGDELFAKIDPEIAAQKCPRLREMLDEMLKIAKAAGQ